MSRDVATPVLCLTDEVCSTLTTRARSRTAPGRDASPGEAGHRLSLHAGALRHSHCRYSPSSLSCDGLMRRS